MNADKGTPDESMTGVTMVYTDNGQKRAVLRSPLILKYGTAQSRTEFPKGLQVDFYNKLGERESYVESDYGIFNEIDHQLLLEHNVQMINFKRADTLDTQYMVWKQDSAIITTVDRQFFMHGPQQSFTGTHFRARENGTRYLWRKTKGQYYYNQTDSLL